MSEMRTLRSKRLLTALGLGSALLLSACVGNRTVGVADGGSKPAPTVPTPPEVKPDRDHANLVAAFGGEYRAPAMEALLAEMTGRLVAATERPDESYRITLLDSPVVNAFALPSGRLYVTRGLLALANDTAELAAVLSHEIAHVTARHASARTELEAKSALVSRVTADVLNNPVEGASLRERSRFRIASFSRSQELEADQAGVRTLAKAGYDPYAAARFLRSLERSTWLKADGRSDRNSESPGMLATHPATSERIALVRQAARRIGAPGLGQADRNRYLAAVTGIAYGDDPRDGLVRGRRFIHPRLRIAFEAPSGFLLDNTPKAVLGTTADESRRLLFDALDAPPGQDLAGVLTSAWTDAVDTGSIETVDIGGRSIVTARSKGKDWNFRLAAFRAGPTTFRLIYAAHVIDEAADRDFRSMLESLREVSAGEASSLRPYRLQTVVASPGDTAAALAAGMATGDRGSDRFLVLNGLERGEALRPGEAYKVVAE